VRIAFLHLAPIPADLAGNRRLIEEGVGVAAREGAAWILTPELGVSGYTFADRIGTGWIDPAPDAWTSTLCATVARLGVTLFLSHPERDPATGALHNSLVVIGADGRIRGAHRKINTLPVGSESWSTPGTLATPVRVEPVGPVGLLICADAYSPWIAKSLRAQGARLLVSAAAWAPGLHGPDGEWEQCTRDTGLPLLVCNRTGADRVLDFRAGSSVVVKDGGRLLDLTAPDSTVFLLDWNVEAQSAAGPPRAIPLVGCASGPGGA
jgi:predicted amidohydrolase